MPYLHWDRLQSFNERAAFLQGVFDGKKPPVPPGLEEQKSALYEISKDCLNEGSSFHPRRSLDQFFYSRLPNTTQRDNDQVVSKNTKWSPDGTKMVMVDQLWLWVIDPNITELEPGGRNTGDKSAREMLEVSEESVHQSLVTFFPMKECDDEEGKKDNHWDTADLKLSILKELGENPPEGHSAWYVAAITIQQAVKAMLEARNESLDFLEIFRAAIGKAGSVTIFSPCPFLNECS